MVEIASGTILTNPIVVGLVVGVPTTLFGFKAYRRAEALDKAALRQAEITAEGDAVQRVIDGLDRLVDNLQADNREVRERVIDLRERLRRCNADYAELKRLMSE